MNTYEIWLGNKVIASVQAHSQTQARMRFADTVEVTEYEG